MAIKQFLKLRRRSESLGQIAEQLSVHSADAGVTIDDFRVYYSNRVTDGAVGEVPSNYEEIMTVGEELMQGQIPSSRRSAIDFLNLYRDYTGYTSPAAGLSDGPHFLSWLSRSVAFTLFAFILYIVIGGILERESAILSESHILVPIGTMVGLIVLLAYLEGLQVSITALRFKDMSSLQSINPRLYNTHRRFNSEERVRKFLSGRQLLVIVIVFFAARVCSFPEMSTWPGTTTEIPSWLNGWFDLVLFDFGVAGAMLTLWAGQLAPQFAANKNPQAFLLLPLAEQLLGLTLFLESLGITKPGNWLPSFIPRGREIAPSREESYRVDLEHGQGWGTARIKAEIHVGRAGVQFHHNQIIEFNRQIESVTVRSMQLHAGGPYPEFRHVMYRKGSIRADVFAKRLEDSRWPAKEEGTPPWISFVQEVSPQFGSFQSGDTLVTSGIVELTTIDGIAMPIDTSTKLIEFRIRFFDDPINITSVSFTKSRYESVTGTYHENPQESLQPVDLGNGELLVEFVERFPEPNIVYDFHWQYSYR